MLVNISHVLQALAAAYIVYLTMTALTKAQSSTRHAVYISNMLLLIGGVLAFVSAFVRLDVFEYDCILTAGVAFYMLSNRRSPRNESITSHESV